MITREEFLIEILTKLNLPLNDSYRDIINPILDEMDMELVLSEILYGNSYRFHNEYGVYNIDPLRILVKSNGELLILD